MQPDLDERVARAPLERFGDARVVADGTARCPARVVFDVLGREGWILVFDADIVLPEHIGDLFPGDALDKDCLYNAERHVLDNQTTWNGAWDWSHIPIDIEVEHPGFFQLFHAEAASLAGKRPWYGIDWTHAGGCDHQFEEQFPEDKRIKRRDIQVLHLGPRDTNWWGRVTPRLDGSVHPEAAQHRDDMERLLRAKGWRRKKTNEAVIERIAIAGAANADVTSAGSAR